MTQLKLNAAYFMIIIYVLFFHGSNTAETTCEKDSEKLKSQERGCGNPCAIVQCRNPRAKCVCDGPCGYVCVTPDLRCSSALNKPKQGKVDLPKESQFQSIAEYTCDKGFELIGLKQRMCQSNGKWSGNEPFCTPKGVRCSEPEFELDNAYIVFSTRKDEYYLGDEVKFTCDLGYVNSKKDILISKCEKKDENTADWTPIQINCKPVSCRQPEDIYNGYIEGNKFSLGSEVKYHCNEGYYLVGFATRVCLAEKVWSSSPPTCEIVQCLEPPQIANGAIQYEDDHLNYLSLIYYKCNPGFILDGPSDRQCGELGEFTGEQPECIEIDCGQPEKPENGTISYLEGTKWTQKVHYLCDPHTTTHGSIVAECKFEYQVAFWNPQPPLCILHCKVPGGIMYFERDNKKIKPGEYILHKEIVKMNCESGYEVENSASNSAITSTCVNGKWSDQIQCTPARCFKNTLNERYLKDQRWSTNRIPSIVNSGDTLTLTCDSSYPEVDKNGFLKCAFGKWQLPEPDIKCRKKSCDVTHVNFSNVVIFYKEKQIDADKLDKIGHGEHFRLSCTKDNYELYSNGELGTHRYSKVDCNEGFLSKNIFECREILRCKCSELKQKLLAKGLEPNYCYNDMDNGKSISISCLENYADANRQIVKCQNTHWQIDSNARCKKKCECRSLNLPKSLKLKKWCYDSVKSGTSLEITCAINFTAIAGNEEISCNEGEWLIDAFCLASCKIPNIPQSIISTNIKTTTKKTLTSANNIVHSDRIKISCQLGYYLSSSNDILQCIDGQYDKEIPACLREAIIEDSTEIMEIEPTAYIDQTDTVYKNKCTYEPPKDKNLLAFCSGKQLSDTHPTSINLNEVVTFRCYNIESFILVGNKSIKCQFLKWKGTIPTCQALKLRSIENAPVITYHVEKDIGFVNNDGTLVIPQDSKLTLRCW
uniref:Sushi domain-containing protein n=1 Tax=Strigamia maritima TaxID=126957 RepID=T1IW92_STRMM